MVWKILTIFGMSNNTGKITKCNNFWCNEKIYVGDSCEPYSCAICSDPASWVKPGKVVPAMSYTTCTGCDCQFMVNKTYYGRLPLCSDCVMFRESISWNVKYCGYCDMYKNHVTYDAHPFNLDGHMDGNSVWMCKICRNQNI